MAGGADPWWVGSRVETSGTGAMVMKKSLKKLELSRETLKQLDERKLKDVIAAGTCPGICEELEA
jgi:hypothetical protein